MKEFEQKVVEVAGKEYTLQKLPNRRAMKLRQQWSSTEVATGIDDVKMIDLCFEHIVVNPKVKLDDFEYISEAEELAGECIEFQYLGKSENSEEK